MLKKSLFATMALALLASLLFGCASGAPTTTQNTSAATAQPTVQATEQPTPQPTPVQYDKNASLKVWFSLIPEENAALQAIAGQFTKETGVKVEIIDNNFFEITKKYPVAASASDAPDLILAQASDLGVLVAADTLRPISFTDDAFAKRFSPVALDAFKYNGKQYGVGYSADAYGIIYNKKLVPELPKTWTEFFKKADELTIKDSNGAIQQYGFMIDPTNYWFVYPLVARNGGYYMGKNPDGAFNTEDLGLNNEGTAKTYQELLELKNKGLTVQATDQNDSNVTKLFTEGKVAMYIYSLWYAQSYKDNNIDYGYAPLPNNDDGTVSKPLGSVLGVVANKYTKYTVEADAFFQYMMTDDRLLTLYKAANGNDAKNGQRNTLNLSVYNSDYVQGDTNLKSLADIGMGSDIFPSNPEATVIWSYSKAAFDSIFYSGASIQDTLNDLQNKVKADIAKMHN